MIQFILIRKGVFEEITKSIFYCLFKRLHDLMNEVNFGKMKSKLKFPLKSA